MLTYIEECTALIVINLIVPFVTVILAATLRRDEAIVNLIKFTIFQFIFFRNPQTFFYLVVKYNKRCGRNQGSAAFLVCCDQKLLENRTSGGAIARGSRGFPLMHCRHPDVTVNRREIGA